MSDSISSDDAPRSIEKIKRDAKHLKRELGIRHHEALDIVSQRHGYRDYRHARAELAPDDEEECL